MITSPNQIVDIGMINLRGLIRLELMAYGVYGYPVAFSLPVSKFYTLGIIDGPCTSHLQAANSGPIGQSQGINLPLDITQEIQTFDTPRFLADRIGIRQVQGRTLFQFELKDDTGQDAIFSSVYLFLNAVYNPEDPHDIERSAKRARKITGAYAPSLFSNE